MMLIQNVDALIDKREEARDIGEPLQAKTLRK